MRIGVVIPCTKQDLPFLKACLESINQQTLQPDAVIVLSSSTTSSDLQIYDVKFTLKLVTTHEVKNTAEMRNTAAVLLDTDIVSFFSPKDIMHPQRLQYIQESFMKYQSDIVLHNYGKKDIQMIQLYGQPTQLANQLQRAPSGCAVVAGGTPIHHSHVSVSKFITSRYRFREDKDNEGRDNSIFCGDVLQMQGVQSVYLTNVLSYSAD
jgi:hypothetical protein